MKTKRSIRKKITAVMLILGILLACMLTGCRTEGKVHSGSEQEPIADNPVDKNAQNSEQAKNLDGLSENQVMTVTVYSPTLQTLEIPVEIDQIHGVSSVKDQLLVFYQRGETLYAGKVSQNNSKWQEYLLETQIKAVYGITTGANGQGSVRFTEEEAQGPTQLLGIYQEDFQLDSHVLLPPEVQDVLGPVRLPDQSYLFWDSNTIYHMAESGELLNATLSTETELSSLVCTEQNCFAIGMTGNQLGVCSVDMDSCELDNFIPLGRSPQYFSYQNGGQKTILVHAGDALYRYEPESQTFTRLIDWISQDIDGSAIRGFAQINDNQIAWTDGKTVTLANLEPKEIERRVLTVAAVGEASPRLEALVHHFNDISEVSYAQIKYYDDPLKLNTEMMAGHSPDVLEMTAVPIMRSERTLTDLLPYLKNDPEFGQVDYETSVLNAMLMDGKLFTMPYSFYLQTVVGRTQDVGTYHNWTMDDLNELLREKGGECTAFPAWMTSEELLRWVVNISLGQFVDWQNRTCDFRSEGFINLLDFCTRMPKEFHADDYISDYGNEVLLTVQMFQNPKLLATLQKNYGGTDITYIGFPGDGTNNGSFFSTPPGELMLAIPQSAEQKEAAWSLIREVCTPAWQEQVRGFPLRDDVLQEQFEAVQNNPEAMLSEENIQKFKDVVSETKVFIFEDNVIGNIIFEEVAPFFQGDRSAEDAAAVIQDRVGLYLMEQG